MKENGEHVPHDVFCNQNQPENNCDVLMFVSLQSNSLHHFRIKFLEKPSQKSLKPSFGNLLQKESFPIQIPLVGNRKLNILSANKFELVTSNETNEFNLAYKFYESSQMDGQASGLYVFRPTDASSIEPIEYSKLEGMRIHEGAISTRLTVKIKIIILLKSPNEKLIKNAFC